MQHLIAGVHKFQQDELGKYRKLFRRLSRQEQDPHTLFITCSDSRVLAELITQSQPGDLFVVKNVGNIVPRADVPGRNSTAAAIEFAVSQLGVSDVVVCGHTQCGAMRALLEGLPESEDLPHLREWIATAAPVRELIEQHYQHLTDRNERITAAGGENVLFALENLHTYPAVAARLAAGTLRLHGWFFEIATAKLFAYDLATQQFQPIEPEP
jgi:carbonic anhydrase